MSTRPLLGAALPAGTDVDGRSLAVTATGIAAVAVSARFVATLVVAVPGAPATAPLDALSVGATGLAAGAAAVVGVTETRPTAGVGALFVGVFGVLGLVSAAAVTPAAVAAVAGLGLVAATHRGTLGRWRGAAAALLVAALATSLAAGIGGIAALRGVGSTLALAGVGVTPVFGATDGRALVWGGAAAGAVLAVGLGLPFVTGAATLAGAGVVGATLPALALAAAGATTAASAAVRTRRWPLLAGVVLLAAAGVPATLSRAVPFALGVVALVSLEVSR